MRLHREKFSLFFFSLLLICAAGVMAQDKNPKRIFIEELNHPSPEIEKKAPASLSFKRSFDFTPPSDSVESPLPAFLKRTGEIDRQEEIKEIPGINRKAEIETQRFNFRPEIIGELKDDFRGESLRELKKIQYHPPSFLEREKAAEDKTAVRGNGFNWRGALTQSFMFIGVQHGYALVFQKKTRQALKGKFFTDWGNSVQALGGWDDGNRFFTNYIAHPMQGSLTGFIYVQNSPQARRQRFGASGGYWRTRMKALIWSTAWSTQFELGPISQASIGNVGLKGGAAWVDLVVTPSVGTALLITEDALDRFVIKPLERRANNFFVRVFLRMLLNPTRNFSNMLRFKEPWFRDFGMNR